jgi:hypothetical protein
MMTLLNPYLTQFLYYTSFNSVADWSLVGSASQLTSGGNPGYCVLVPSGSRATKNCNTVITSMAGRSFQCDMMIPSPGGTNIVEMYIGCNSAGVGVICRLDLRAGQPCGVWNSSAWGSNAGGGSTGSVISGALDTWYTMRADISASNVVTLYVNGTLVVSAGTRTFSGLYVGLVESFVSARYDNFAIK